MYLKSRAFKIKRIHNHSMFKIKAYWKLKHTRNQSVFKSNRIQSHKYYKSNSEVKVYSKSNVFKIKPNEGEQF